MSELGDLYKEVKSKTKATRQSSLQINKEILNALKIDYVELHETHLRIGDFDFWPSTGKYLDRKKDKYYQGIVFLIMDIRKREENGKAN